MKNQKGSIAAYVEAVEQLQESVNTFRTSRQSLQEASASLHNITQFHGDVAKSLGSTEKRILELLPDEFQHTLSQQQQDIDDRLNALQAQFSVIEKATATTAASLKKLEQNAQVRSLEFNERMKNDTMQVVQEFGRRTQVAATGITSNVRVSVDALSQNVDRLVTELQSEEFLKSIGTFTGELNRSTEKSERAAEVLLSTSNGFSALLTDATGSVHASLSTLANADRVMPNWAKILLISQILVIILVMVVAFG